MSNSADKKQFQQNGAVALRIGMLIGMLVDTHDAQAKSGESISLATVWNSAEAGEEMTRIMKDFPEVETLPLYSGSGDFG